MAKKDEKKREFGDFQTPDSLSRNAVNSLCQQLSFQPSTIIEPTCGVGSFLLAAAEAFPEAQKIIGAEIKAEYLEVLKQQIIRKNFNQKIELINGDFFNIDWAEILKDIPKPILIVGNPPWVTNSEIGGLNGKNLPKKANFQKNRGVDAITGKANFDISEWMIIQHLDWLQKYTGAIAMLCKTSVARKILRHAWKNRVNTISARMIQIDTMANFGAAVDACFLIMETNHKETSTNCKIFLDFETHKSDKMLGYHEGLMLSDVSAFHKYYNLIGNDPNYIWRSGIKHDCSKIMELKIQGNQLINGNGDLVDIEDTFTFHLLKSSDLANERFSTPRFKVLVTQRKIGEDTSKIRNIAPKTWRYLINNSNLLDKRSSIIYREKPRFSIFGIGLYSFSKWKVAISGFYKKLKFDVISPLDGKPVMLDDTAYFLNCFSQEEALFISDLLNSEIAKSILSSLVFWSDKRPITVDILKRLNIKKLAEQLGCSTKYQYFVKNRLENSSQRKDTEYYTF